MSESNDVSVNILDGHRRPFAHKYRSRGLNYAVGLRINGNVVFTSKWCERADADRIAADLAALHGVHVDLFERSWR